MTNEALREALDSSEVLVDNIISSSLKAVNWNSEKRLLFITFGQGTVYAYENIPDAIVDTLKSNSDSTFSYGSYVNKNITGKDVAHKYPYTRVV